MCVSRKEARESAEMGERNYLDILFLFRVHSHLRGILAGLVALAGVDVVRVGLDGSLALIHGGSGGRDRQVGRVGERHVTISWVEAKKAPL